MQKGKSLHPEDRPEVDDASAMTLNSTKDAITRLENLVDVRQQESAKMKKFVGDLKVGGADAGGHDVDQPQVWLPEPGHGQCEHARR